MPIPRPPTADELRMHPVVSRDEWLKARKLHLRNEKALTRMRDILSAERRRLPWVRIEKDYTFEGPEGEISLAELFEGRSQLIVQHFMFGPDWQAGCPGCSFDADHTEGAVVHLENHDVTYVRISRAPLQKIEAYRQRMGWKAKWVSSCDCDFNYDFNVSFTSEQIEGGKVSYNFEEKDGRKLGIEELSGISVFFMNEDGEIFHTYSSYARGNEEVGGALVLFDLTPKGRNENVGFEWLRRHDEYGNESGGSWR